MTTKLQDRHGNSLVACATGDAPQVSGTKELRQYYASQGRPDLVTTLLAERTKAGDTDDPDAEVEVVDLNGTGDHFHVRVISVSFGTPFRRSRPLIIRDVPLPSSGIRAVPIEVLIRSAVLSPTSRFCWRRK